MGTHNPGNRSGAPCAVSDLLGGANAFRPPLRQGSVRVAPDPVAHPTDGPAISIRRSTETRGISA